MQTASAYYDGLNVKLLAALPADARRVLELGCANGRLGRRYKEDHPGVEWWGVDVSADAAAQAAAHLDQVRVLDLDRTDLRALGGGFDTIVIGDLLEHLRDPAPVLEALYDLATPDARILCCLPNMAHLSVLERLVAGDIGYDAAGLLDQTHLRWYSQASAFKTFLDAGWLPRLHDQYRVDVPQTRFAACIVQAAEALGVPAAIALRNLGMYQMILHCTRWDMSALARPAPALPVSVVVPVNRPWQYELNLARSPGLREIGAEVIPVQGAESAAQAFAIGAERASHAWRVLVHQDVYFPVGSGHALVRGLAAVEQAGLRGAPVGFAGIEPGEDGRSVRHAGLVIDRTHCFDHPGGQQALSLDELAIALHRDSALTIDPALGWHLWGTDLCLQACHRAGRAVGQVLRVPLFHNSTNTGELPAAFHDSAAVLLERHPEANSIPTLCGRIQRPAAAVNA